jgi:hypothetical protein
MPLGGEPIAEDERVQRDLELHHQPGERVDAGVAGAPLLDRPQGVELHAGARRQGVLRETGGFARSAQPGTELPLTWLLVGFIPSRFIIGQFYDSA